MKLISIDRRYRFGLLRNVLLFFSRIGKVTAVYQKRHPGAFWVGFGDFTWFRLTNIKSVRLLARQRRD